MSLETASARSTGARSIKGCKKVRAPQRRAKGEMQALLDIMEVQSILKSILMISAWQLKIGRTKLF